MINLHACLCIDDFVYMRYWGCPFELPPPPVLSALLPLEIDKWNLLYACLCIGYLVHRRDWFARVCQPNE